jgi:hypothetical protein
LASVLAVLYLGARTPQETQGSYRDVRVRCRACGHEAQIPASEYARLRAGDPKKKLLCGACGKDSAEAMMPCPKCRKWYLPKAETAVHRHVCPHCGYDAESG